MNNNFYLQTNATIIDIKEKILEIIYQSTHNK
jgi:hypothetical protein